MGTFLVFGGVNFGFGGILELASDRKNIKRATGGNYAETPRRWLAPLVSPRLRFPRPASPFYRPLPLTPSCFGSRKAWSLHPFRWRSIINDEHEITTP